MLDARNIYRKVTRKIYDFSPEQLANLTAIVWLYRGQQDRYLGLVQEYFGSLCHEAAAVAPELASFEANLADLKKLFSELNDALKSPLIKGDLGGFVSDGKKQIPPSPPFSRGEQHLLADALAECAEATTAYQVDRSALLNSLVAFLKANAVAPTTNTQQHTARQAFDPLADRIKGLVKQVDLLYKLAARGAQVANEISLAPSGGEGRGEGVVFDRRTTSKLLKQLDEQRKQAVEQLKQTVYFYRQIHWLQERFPAAEMAAVPGLCRVVSRADIEAADWSLTPGRYVGVALAEVDEDFDFEQTIKDIHLELKDLNAEAVELAARIQENFEELGV
jgi:type I restriction enzyme M protein